MHAHTRTHTLMNGHTVSNAHTQECAHACTHKNTHNYTLTTTQACLYALKHARTRTHPCTHTHTHTYARTHSHMHPRTRTLTPKNSQEHRHVLMHARTGTRAFTGITPSARTHSHRSSRHTMFSLWSWSCPQFSPPTQSLTDNEFRHLWPLCLIEGTSNWLILVESELFWCLSGCCVCVCVWMRTQTARP